MGMIAIIAIRINTIIIENDRNKNMIDNNKNRHDYCRGETKRPEDHTTKAINCAKLKILPLTDEINV